MEIYRRYWRRDDNDWEPGSFGWPSDHDKTLQLERFATPRRGGGCYVITYQTSFDSAYVVEQKGQHFFITDCDLGWGEGVVFAHT